MSVCCSSGDTRGLRQFHMQVVRWLSVCGDGVIEGVEECDDGNTKSGDGCSAFCQVRQF